MKNMSKDYPQTGIRVKPEIMDKFRAIAEFNGRSMNKEIEQLILKHVQEFEDKFGEIDGTPSRK